MSKEEKKNYDENLINFIIFKKFVILIDFCRK